MPQLTIFKNPDNIYSDDLEVSAEAVVVPKHSPLTPLVEVDLRIPYEPYRCHSLLHLFKYLDIEDDLLINLNSNNFRFKWL